MRYLSILLGGLFIVLLAWSCQETPTKEVIPEQQITLILYDDEGRRNYPMTTEAALQREGVETQNLFYWEKIIPSSLHKIKTIELSEEPDSVVYDSPKLSVAAYSDAVVLTQGTTLQIMTYQYIDVDYNEPIDGANKEIQKELENVATRYPNQVILQQDTFRNTASIQEKLGFYAELVDVLLFDTTYVQLVFMDLLSDGDSRTASLLVDLTSRKLIPIPAIQTYVGYNTSLNFLENDTLEWVDQSNDTLYFYTLIGEEFVLNNNKAVYLEDCPSAYGQVQCIAGQKGFSSK